MFGFTEEHLESLLTPATADWHMSHDDVASAFQDLRSARSVEALAHLATWVPDYLEFDEARALAVKAIWALGAIETEAARATLGQLRTSDVDVIAENARYQLEQQSVGRLGSIEAHSMQGGVLGVAAVNRTGRSDVYRRAETRRSG